MQSIGSSYPQVEINGAFEIAMKVCSCNNALNEHAEMSSARNLASIRFVTKELNHQETFSFHFGHNSQENLSQ